MTTARAKGTARVARAARGSKDEVRGHVVNLTWPLHPSPLASSITLRYLGPWRFAPTFGPPSVTLLKVILLSSVLGGLWGYGLSLLGLKTDQCLFWLAYTPMGLLAFTIGLKG